MDLALFGLRVTGVPGSSTWTRVLDQGSLPHPLHRTLGNPLAHRVCPQGSCFSFTVLISNVGRLLAVSGVSSPFKEWGSGSSEPPGRGDLRASWPHCSQPKTGPLVLNSKANKSFSQSTLSIPRLCSRSSREVALCLCSVFCPQS